MGIRLGTRVGTALLAVLVGGALCSCRPLITGPALVLRLASPDKASDPTGLQIQHFAEEVDRRSGGTIRIEPVWGVTPPGVRGWDQLLAQKVAEGIWDMGLVPGRAWDMLGVKELRALNTPFLITSTAALRRVLDSSLRDDLLAGLPTAGVVGVDLFPDELRHPFGFEAPLLGAEDYQGQVIRAPLSATVTRMFAALGSEVTDKAPDRRAQRGAESSYSYRTARIATGNVTFFPKTDALVLRASIRDHLRDDQWTLLRDAAAATRDWLFDREPTDLEAAMTFCSHGGSIAAATPQQIADLKAATEPVTRWLRDDADTRRLVDAIRSRIAGVPSPAPVTHCPGTGTETAPSSTAWRSAPRRVTERVTKAAG